MQRPSWNDGSGHGGGPQMQLAMPSLTPVTKKLLILNVAAFLAVFVISVGSSSAARVILNGLGLTPAVWVAWFPVLPLWQLLTYGFLHSTSDFGHILWNMLQLYFFGTMLESQLGGRRFLAFYLLALVVGACLHLVVELLTGGGAPVIGASGAVLGVVVAAATLQPRTRVFLFFIPVTLGLLAAGIVAIDALSAVRDLSQGTSDGVAHWVHLGGALCGFVMVRTGWIRIDWLERLSARRAIRKEEQRVREEYDMDQLLEKIHREGMNSLSRAEKEFLKRVSRRKP